MSFQYQSLTDAQALKDLYDLISVDSGTLARSSSETDIRYFQEAIDKSNLSGINYGAYDNGKLVAFIYAYKFEPKVFDHTLANMTLGVHTAYQGQGLGSKLLDLFITRVKESQEIKRVELFTPAINFPAIKLYEKFGFVKEGAFKRRAFFKGAFVDDIPMAWLRN